MSDLVGNPEDRFSRVAAQSLFFALNHGLYDLDDKNKDADILTYVADFHRPPYLTNVLITHERSSRYLSKKQA